MNELTYNLAQPEQALKLAETLQRFVKEKKLTANIKGKEYPLVESWLFAGSQLGLYPLLTSIENQSTGQEIKYMATVEVRKISDDKVMSRGIAVCSNKEYSKKQFDEYAILSMAQTRAEGKAFRMLLSWIMKAAGFEATPAEEMDFNKAPDEVGDDGRDFLLNLLDSSSYEGKARDMLKARISDIMIDADYQKAKTNLLANQVGIDSVSNPTQRDINQHLKRVGK